MSADARVTRAIIALRTAVMAANDEIPRDDQGRCPDWWMDLDMAAEALCGEARDALHLNERDVERCGR
jgi:hypothetical protein